MIVYVNNSNKTTFTSKWCVKSLGVCGDIAMYIYIIKFTYLKQYAEKQYTKCWQQKQRVYNMYDMLIWRTWFYQVRHVPGSTSLLTLEQHCD